MSEQETSVSVANAMVFVECRDGGELPESLSEGPVTATGSSILIGTRSDVDGPTKLRIFDGEDARAVAGGQLIHSQELPVPSGVLTIKDVYLKELVSCPAPPQIRVEILVDDPTEPADIAVFFNPIR